MHRSRRRRARMGAVALAIVLLGAACAHPQDVEGSRILVIGDSLLEDSVDEVRAALETDGWQATVVGIGGLPIQSWIDGARDYSQLTYPDFAVVELGTNNCAASPCEDLRAYIDAIVHELAKSARVVYWLNVQEDVPIAHPVHADYVNRQIADAAVRWPNLVMLDMNGRFAGHPEWHVSDGLHFNDAGQQQLAELIRDAVHANSPAARAGGSS